VFGDGVVVSPRYGHTYQEQDPGYYFVQIHVNYVLSNSPHAVKVPLHRVSDFRSKRLAKVIVRL
jgi:hypothetical protein